MSGCVIVACMTMAIIVLPCFYQQSPIEIRPWLGSKKPGFSHPLCQSQNFFSAGKTPDTSTELISANEIVIVSEKNITDEYRIVTRKGIINRITKVKGAERLSVINIDPNAESIREILEDGRVGRELPKDSLVVGKPPPKDYFKPKQRVMFIQIQLESQTIRHGITLQDHIVQSIISDSEEVETLELDGKDITEVLADGQSKTQQHLLGTDELGRDVLSRILYGGRISLSIGISATLVSLIIGVCYGAISGYLGGKTDRLMMAFVDILYGIPFMFLVIILLVLFGRNIIILFIALGAVQWLTMARIIRGQILSLKELEFVAAARISGASHLKIIFRHLIPNAMGPMIIYATLTVPVIILEESFLSFIGLTVQFRGQNLDSWGALVHQGMQALGTDGGRSWLLIWPSLAMALTLLGLNCLGDGLRDCFDPKTRKIG